MSKQVPEDFGFTDDHDLLRKTARRFLKEKCPIGEIRRLADDDLGYDPAVWREQVEMGWVDPELDHLSTALLLEEMGRRLCPTPLFSSLVAALAIERTGSEEHKKRWLPRITSGEVLAALATTETDASWEAESVHARAEARDGGYALYGEKTHVLWGQRAGLLVAPFSLDDARALFALELPCPGVRVEPEVPVDATRRTARIAFDGARVEAENRLGDDGVDALREIHLRAAALLAAEMVGAAEAVLAMTRDYALERVQFGRPIGAFQAVKHPLVDMMISIEKARSLVYAAASAFDSGADEAETLARMAKAAAGDALSYAADRGVQLHGGFGFTWDCDVHFYFKRAMWSSATLGDARHHRRHLAERLQDLGAAEEETT